MGMGEIKENEATVNEMTQENVEEQPVVYKEYSTEYLVSAVEAILFWKFITSLTGALRWSSLKMHISCVPEMSTTMC